MEHSSVVIVGQSKPVLNYVTACITILNRGERQVILRARGEAINIAVEVAAILKHKFVSDIGISKVHIDGETVTTKEGRLLHLPVLEIVLKRGSKATC